MVQADIHHHPIEPSGKTRLKAEVAEGAVNLQKRLLVKVSSLFLGVHHLQRKAKHVSIVHPHQRLEGFRVPSLGAADQRYLVRPAQLPRLFWYVSGQLQATFHHRLRLNLSTLYDALTGKK